MALKQVTMLQIDYFLAVAEYLNFTEAAKMLYTSQPSISKQIFMLEKQIGTDLFYRNKRSVRLTPSGEVLLKELSGITEQIEDAIRAAKDTSLSDLSTINIGLLDCIDTNLFLNKFMNKFKCEHKNISLNFERHSFKILREKLINGRLDIVFTLSFEVDDTQGLNHKIIHKTNSVIAMSEDDPMAKMDKVTIEDLKDKKFVMISREESAKGFDGIVDLCKKHGYIPNIVKQLPNIESILLCVESGMGVTILDSTIRLHNIENFKIYPIEEDFIYTLVAWKKENLNPSILVLVDELMDHIKEEPTDLISQI